MQSENTDVSPATAVAPDRWPVRVWPGVVIVAVAAAAMTLLPMLAPRTMAHFIGLFAAPLLGCLAAVGWWVFGSRVRGRMRWLVPVLVLGPVVPVVALIYPKNPPAVVLYALSLILLLWVGWLAVSGWLPGSVRRGGLIVALLAGWLGFVQVRVDGTDADLVPDLRFWWQPSAEDRFLAERPAITPAPAAVTAEPVVVGPGDWAEFRGPARDGRVTGLTIQTDWAAHPPTVAWKQRIGPGWGTFAVVGDRLFTQEQRGDAEATVCYAADTGVERWEHREPARFTEAIAGAGPRATPTVADGKVFALGATGKLACLDAATGAKVWVRDVAADAGAAVPQWGFASSPLVRDGLVFVCGCGGAGGKGTLAYRADTGDLAWAAGGATHSYSSPHAATFDGVSQVLQVSDIGLEAFAPADGKLLWSFPWPIKDVNRVTQPALVGDADVVIGTGVGPDQGLRRVHVSRTGESWTATAVWSSRGMRPYFNDAVVHAGHLYGFDDGRLCCVELATGKRTWSESVYGHGQVLLLADQGLLLVAAVTGELALVEANPSEFTELGKVPAIHGKTWNHLAVARGRVFVRNGEEAACLKLPVK